MAAAFPAILALTLAAALAGAEGPAPDRPWFEGRSEHFIFITDGREPEARQLAGSLEAFRTCLEVVPPDRRSWPEPGPRPSLVYLFATRAGFEGHAADEGSGGYCEAHPDGDYIALDAGAEGAEAMLRHEYVHQFLNAHDPDIPPWLNEGLACFYQTLERSGRDLRLGAPPPGYLQVLQERGILPVARLRAVTHQSPEYRVGTGRNRFYASAWLLTARLMTGGDSGRAKVGAYLDDLRAGRGPAEAFARAFAQPVDRLDQELKEFLTLLQARRTPVRWTVPCVLAPPGPGFQFAPLAPAEALGRLGLLLLSADRGRARAYGRAALALDPGSPAGNLALALAALAEGHPEQVAGNFEKAAAGDPDSGLLHYWAGVSGYQAHIGAGLSPELRAARDHLRRAIGLGGTRPNVFPMLAAVALLEPRPAPEDLECLDRACQAPGQWPLRLNLAILHGRAGHGPRARALFQEVAGQKADPDLARLALADRDALDHDEAEARYQEAMAALRGEDLAGARAALEAALRLAPAGALRQQIQAALDQLGARKAPRRGPRPANAP